MNAHSRLKHTLKYITPPLLIDLAKRWRVLLRLEKPEWQYVPEGWARQQTDPNIRGWNLESVLEAQKASWPIFLRQLEQSIPFSAAPVELHPDLAYHNTMLIYAYALALAARNQTTISLLDWGGGLGHYYLIGKSFMPDLEIDYHCKDLPLVATYGQQLLPEAHFYSDDSCLARRYDFVLASTSLHYAQEWATTLQALAHTVRSYLLVTQLPVTLEAASFVFVQRPYRYHYQTEYLSWCLNRAEFLHSAEHAGLSLVREFINGYSIPIPHAPAPYEYRAFLFRPVENHD